MARNHALSRAAALNGHRRVLRRAATVMPGAGESTRFTCSGRPRSLLSGVLLVALLGLLGGCSWTVVPPQAVSEPRTVFVNQYGWHTRLALPAPDSRGYIEYGIGDWRYYAQGERGLLSGFQALFSSEATALSRRELPPVGEEDAQSRFGSLHSAALEAPQERVAELRRDLEATWEANPTPTLAHGGQRFRKIDRRYGLFSNSNHQTAEWLRRIGSEVRGVTILGDFRVD